MWPKCTEHFWVGGALLLLATATIAAAAAEEDAVSATRPRQCFSCAGINCQRTSKTNVVVECTDLLDFCVTVFDGFAVVARDCYANLPEEYRAKCDAAVHPECVKCFGQRCNTKGRADFKCFDCNSNDNSKCASDTADMVPVQCQVPTALNSYCFVRSSAVNGAVTRGCFVHQKDQVDCLKDDSCSMCSAEDEEACNSYRLQTVATAGAGAAALGWSSLLAVAVVGAAQVLRVH